jgi:hypothetical protein
MVDKTNTLKWSARIIGGLSLLFFGVFLIGEGIPDLLKSYNGNLASMLILLGFAAMGYLFAWFREKEGGIILIISGCIMGLNMFYSGGLKDIVFVLVYSLPFIIAGILFFLVGKKTE